MSLVLLGPQRLSQTYSLPTPVIVKRAERGKADRQRSVSRDEIAATFRRMHHPKTMPRSPARQHHVAPRFSLGFDQYHPRIERDLETRFTRR